MFRKLYLAGASPPRLPGAGPGRVKRTYTTHHQIDKVFKEIEHGH
jgi:hypothetical protein